MIHDRYKDPLRVGSTGAGVTLDKGVTTALNLQKSHRSRVSVSLNGRPLNDPVVSRKVIEEYLRLDGRTWRVKVSHKCELPIGCGYGTSGAGALGLSLALNDAMGLGLSKIETAGIAHICEVRCKTGLGTVTSLFYGGFNVRTKPGAPGLGEVRKVKLSKSLRVVSATFGPISTMRVLSNNQLRKRVNTCARTRLSKILGEMTETAFVGLSKTFAVCLGLISSRLGRAMDALYANGISSSMIMLGESLFCILPDDSVSKSLQPFRNSGLAPVVCKIATFGARLV